MGGMERGWGVHLGGMDKVYWVYLIYQVLVHLHVHVHMYMYI